MFKKCFCLYFILFEVFFALSPAFAPPREEEEGKRSSRRHQVEREIREGKKKKEECEQRERRRAKREVQALVPSPDENLNWWTRFLNCCCGGYDEEDQKQQYGCFHKFERDSMQVFSVICTFMSAGLFLSAVFVKIAGEDNTVEALLMGSTFFAATAERFRARRVTIVEKERDLADRKRLEEEAAGKAAEAREKGAREENLKHLEAEKAELLRQKEKRRTLRDEASDKESTLKDERRSLAEQLEDRQEKLHTLLQDFTFVEELVKKGVSGVRSRDVVETAEMAPETSSFRLPAVGVSLSDIDCIFDRVHEIAEAEARRRSRKGPDE